MSATDYRPALNRRAGGSRAARVGREFENRIQSQLAIARANRLVEHFVHTEPAFAMRKRKNAEDRGFAPIAPGVADFSGHLFGGLALAIEAKSESGRRFNISRISDNQIAHLNATARGGLSLLALEFRDMDRGLCEEYVVPWREAPWEVAVSARTLTAAGLERGGWRAQRPHVFARFLVVCPECCMVWPRYRARVCSCGTRLQGDPHAQRLQVPQAHHLEPAEGGRPSGEGGERPAAADQGGAAQAPQREEA